MGHIKKGEDEGGEEEVKLSTATSLGSLQLQLLIFSLRIIGKWFPTNFREGYKVYKYSSTRKNLQR